MVALFKDRSPAAVAWLVLLSIVVHSRFVVAFQPLPALPPSGLLSTFLNHFSANIPPVAGMAAYFIIIIVEALRLNYLFMENRMYSRNNYLPALVYILLTGIFTEFSRITPALIDNILVIWLFAKTIRLYNTANPKTLLFDIGFIIGVSVLLYLPSALLVLVAFFALLVVRPFVVTEWLVLLLGVLFPYYILAAYLYLTDNLSAMIRYIPGWQLNLPDTQINTGFFVTTALVIVILMIGLFYWQKESLRLLIHVRKNWGVLMVMLLIMLPIPFINKDAGLESLLLWIVPASPFIAKGFLAPKRNLLPSIMFWSLLLLCLVKSWR